MANEAKMSLNPTILIIPGAWLLPKCYEGFQKQLLQAGYGAEVVSLPSVGGTTSPLPGLSEDISAVRTRIIELSEGGQIVILLCHSYGGIVGSSAVEGLDITSRSAIGNSGGVVQIIFMSAYVVPKGSSLRSIHGNHASPSWMRFQDDRVFVEPEGVRVTIFGGLPDQQAMENLRHLSYTTKSVFTSPSTYAPWDHGLSCSILFSTEDMSLPLTIQKQMAAELGPKAITLDLQSGHCPFLSNPDQLIDAIRQSYRMATRDVAK